MDTLPVEIILHILGFLPGKDKLSARLVSHLFHTLIPIEHVAFSLWRAKRPSWVFLQALHSGHMELAERLLLYDEVKTARHTDYLHAVMHYGRLPVCQWVQARFDFDVNHIRKNNYQALLAACHRHDMLVWFLNTFGKSETRPTGIDIEDIRHDHCSVLRTAVQCNDANIIRELLARFGHALCVRDVTHMRFFDQNGVTPQHKWQIVGCQSVIYFAIACGHDSTDSHKIAATRIDMLRAFIAALNMTFADFKESIKYALTLSTKPWIMDARKIIVKWIICHFHPGPHIDDIIDTLLI